MNHPVVRFLAPIVVAAILGPLIAALGVGLMGVVGNIIGGEFGPLKDEVGFFVFIAIFAYVIGLPVAVLAGLLVSLWMIRHPPNALVVNAAAVIATALFMGVAASGVLGPVEQTHGRSNFLFTLVLAVVAANVCWLLLRRFALKGAREAT